jgi:hypothetical protein
VVSPLTASFKDDLSVFAASHMARLLSASKEELSMSLSVTPVVANIAPPLEVERFDDEFTTGAEACGKSSIVVSCGAASEPPLLVPDDEPLQLAITKAMPHKNNKKVFLEFFICSLARKY